MEKRTERLTVFFSEKEMSILKVLANENGLALAPYIRSRLLAMVKADQPRKQDNEKPAKKTPLEQLHPRAVNHGCMTLAWETFSELACKQSGWTPAQIVAVRQEYARRLAAGEVLYYDTWNKDEEPRDPVYQPRYAQVSGA